MTTTTTEWLDWRDREGTPVKQGDWITTKEGRNLEVKEQTPGRMLYLEANDGHFMPKWMLNWDKVRECLRNPILSPSNAEAMRGGVDSQNNQTASSPSHEPTCSRARITNQLR